MAHAGSLGALFCCPEPTTPKRKQTRDAGASDERDDDRRRDGDPRPAGSGRRARVRLSRAAPCCRSTTRCSTRTRCKHILVRHEQGAVHAAEGYARSSGKVGVRARHLRPRRDQRGHRPHRRADGFRPDRLHHRAGADAPHRLRRLPGMRHGRHHPPLHQAQLPREVDRGPAAHPARGVLRRRERPARARSSSTCRRTSSSSQRPLRAARATTSTRPTGRRSRATSSKIRAAVELMAAGQAPGVLHRRRGRSTPGPQRGGAAARARAADRLPDHLDADGARRLSRPPTRSSSACSACTAPTRRTSRCTSAT